MRHRCKLSFVGGGDVRLVGGHGDGDKAGQGCVPSYLCSTSGSSSDDSEKHDFSIAS